uniref:Gelsolin-like domain-containing protein n=1 Tax=Trichuris muris TaxID=70415 RepID=A0A5S6QHV9_TRIMR
MACTGVLPFVRGIDFSRNDFSENLFPEAVGDMVGLRWLKLNHTQLDKIPEQLSRLKNLEHLHLIDNALTSLHGELSDLPNLRSIIARKNQIKISGIPTDIFDMQDLTVIDFSHNNLKETPPNLDRARSAIVLNLSCNMMESIPSQLFINTADLIYLDLSSNKLTMLPPQIRRLVDLQVLILNDNPLCHFQLKQLPCMTFLRVLHMRNTCRNAGSIPSSLDNLVNLEDVDFSCNELKEVPDALYKLQNLRRLNLSQNSISSLEGFADCWPKLEVLNLSRNNLRSLPDMITRMSKLRLLFVNENDLTFEGIPSGIGKLVNLEVFHAAYNKLELVPEGLCRCVKLRKVKLNNNKLMTIPSSIYLLADLVELDLRNNPDLMVPMKPTEQKKKDRAFYNIDFSLEHQLKLSEAWSPTSSVSSSLASVAKDPISRKVQFLRRRRGQTEADSDQRKILQGMSDVAKERQNVEQNPLECQESLRASKRWDEALEKPSIDYSELFEPDVGQIPGLTIFEIENFLPNQLDSAFHGKFYEGDCYIVLKTVLDESNSLDWLIYYWIGESASIDKKACAAIHAVNLRNFLGAQCRTIREEMNDESDEFLDLFDEDVVYITGARTSSGFFTTEGFARRVQLYMVSSDRMQLHLESVPVSLGSLDPRFVFILDADSNLYVWCGKRSKLVLRTKARLFAEKMNKTERKGLSEIELFKQGSEPAEFWTLLNEDPNAIREAIVEHVSPKRTEHRPKLYQVCLGMGYLELPQVTVTRKGLKQCMLEAKCVYILDCHSDLFLWIGKKSTRLVRAAGFKLASELHAMLDRPEYASVSQVSEGTETMLFKSKFVGWDDVIAVDFTRTAESVQRRGADLNVIMERDKIKTDLSSLFLERQQVINDEEADQMIQECNEDLELMEPFVLEGRKFVRLPEKEYGIFYTCDCYVFLCRYWMPVQKEESVFENRDETSGSAEEGANAGGEAETPAGETEDDFKCVVYFWQGRDASNMGWLTFTFSLQKKFESLFKDKLEVVRMYQQQENQKFLSHFKKMVVIHRGRRNLSMFPGAQRWPECYHLRANGSAICSRTIQIDCDAALLNSGFCYFLKVPFNVPDEVGKRGKVFVWVGSLVNENTARLAEEIAKAKLNQNNWPVVRIAEGSEPEMFWEAMGGKKQYDKNADFMRYCRLFRCTNEKGYFVVSEKTIDFCQDDLDDEDVMFLDNGDQVYLWAGAKSSDVEIKLSFKAAKVYVEHVNSVQKDRPRKLFITVKGKEAQRFRKCFHAWGKHKVPPGEL